MADMLKLKRKLSAARATVLLDLQTSRFYGAAAYVVNKNAKSKIYDYLDAQRLLNVPYDNFLRDLIHASKVKGFVAFPFVTSVSQTADRSTIRDPNANRAEAAWNLFRRMIWQEGSWEGQREAIEGLSQGVGLEAKAYAALWAFMVDSASR
jgi:hypothetical protein